jgi:hypothetical protein
MITLGYDREHAAVIIEFAGRIDAAQAEQFYARLDAIVPTCRKGFSILTDLSKVEEMDFDIRGWIQKAMELFNRHGVTNIIRIIPDPAKDIGFNIMSMFHYSSDVAILTVESRGEALAHLKQLSGQGEAQESREAV